MTTDIQVILRNKIFELLNDYENVNFIDAFINVETHGSRQNFKVSGRDANNKYRMENQVFIPVGTHIDSNIEPILSFYEATGTISLLFIMPISNDFIRHWDAIMKFKNTVRGFNDSIIIDDKTYKIILNVGDLNAESNIANFNGAQVQYLRMPVFFKIVEGAFLGIENVYSLKYGNTTYNLDLIDKSTSISSNNENKATKGKTETTSTINSATWVFSGTISLKDNALTNWLYSLLGGAGLISEPLELIITYANGYIFTRPCILTNVSLLDGRSEVQKVNITLSAVAT